MIRTDRLSSPSEQAPAIEPSSRPVGNFQSAQDVDANGDASSESQLQKIFATAMMTALGDEDGTRSDGFRQAASASHALGTIYRRQERCDDARRAHLATLHLRDQHGSFEELWETAIELALDARIAGRAADSRRWSESAIDFAKSASEESDRKQAVAWSDLSRMLTEAGHHEDAIKAAEEAVRCRKRDDVGAIDTAQSERLLGEALLGYARCSSDANFPEALPIVNRAISQLDAARAALKAFGPVAATDAQSCRDGLDFANRLRASLDG